MGSWEKLNETSIPPKELFCSELNLEDITNEDYAHVQTVWDVFEIKNSRQSDTLLLTDVFENFRDKCIEVYGLDPAHFFVSTWIRMAILFRKNRSKFRIINRY